ncbi:sucrase ferredoxin [Arhodomonas sp. AD133]|uniref:sucrase ferredoxin n=1 Tax=Arhodomonas sp. AD133 TaxID=3415009 RepID=UPI003EB96BF5
MTAGDERPAPRPRKRFCAVDSLADGDPLAGTGAHLERNLLVSWPRAKWLRSMRKARDMPDGIAEALDTIAAAGRRVNLIHRRDRPDDMHRVVLMPECRAFELPREALAGFLHALASGTDLKSWPATRVQWPMLLCCTHGRKDKCCAKFGYAAYSAFAEAVRRHDLGFDVWESTHLGGCRLAAGAVLLPRLRKYGRIAPADVLPLLRAEAAGRPYLPCYRGDSRLPPPAQCAEVAALQWLQARGHTGDVSVEPPDDDVTDDALRIRVHWRADSHGGRLLVTCRAMTLKRHDTCADYGEGPPSPSTVWHAVHIEPCPANEPVTQ